MGVTVFWILLTALIAVLVVSPIIHDRKRRNARYENIQKGFGLKNIEGELPIPPVKAPALFEYLLSVNNGDFCIDDITWSDLALNDIYARMNRCVTSAGEEYIWCRLRMLFSDAGKAAGIFEKIRYFILHKDDAVRYLKILDRYGKSRERDDFELVNSISDTTCGTIASDLICIILLFVSVILTTVYPLAGFAMLIIMIIVSIGLYFSGKRRMEEQLLGLSLALKLIGCANDLSKEGADEFGRYDHLKSLTKCKFLIPFKERTVSDPFSIVYDYVRMITHIDLIAFKLMISKAAGYKEELCNLYIDIGRFDTILAVSSYLADRKHCEARVNSNNSIIAERIWHPLVRKPVCNDIKVERGVLLTGSNASGKSTFLKSIGLNVLFARSFGFALADRFETGKYDLYTSMALSDNILHKQSYYVVEARSIKRICDAAEKGMCLCIIDEVLRGTNTVERIAASSQILKYLNKPNVLCFAATHDLELTHLLEDDMDMYYFTEEISDGDVTFPFVIQKGYTDKTNAIRLLDMFGFDKGIVAAANGLVEKYRSTGKW